MVYWQVIFYCFFTYVFKYLITLHQFYILGIQFHHFHVEVAIQCCRKNLEDLIQREIILEGSGRPLMCKCIGWPMSNFICWPLPNDFIENGKTRLPKLVRWLSKPWNKNTVYKNKRVTCFAITYNALITLLSQNENEYPEKSDFRRAERKRKISITFNNATNENSSMWNRNST